MTPYHPELYGVIVFLSPSFTKTTRRASFIVMDDRPDKISYDHLVYDALRGMVRQVLARVQRKGLPGQHHFYISFQTSHPDVVVAERLKKRYPKEMTIVMQHQFENLQVEEDKFSLTLYFDRTPERIIVPWTALTSFTDPHASFSLRLATIDDGAPQQKPPEEKNKPLATKTSQVVELDAFRKKK